MTLLQRLTVCSAIALRWKSSLSVTRAPMRRPQAFQTFDVVSMLTLRPSMPSTSAVVTPQTLLTEPPV